MARWFGPGLRSSIATEVEEVVVKPGRTYAKSFYDEKGRDVRLSVPGVRWGDVRERRKEALESFKERCQEAFDKVYQQIMEGRRTSMSHHLLPTIKTPAIPKVQSRLGGDADTSPQAPVPPPPASPPTTTPLSTVFTPRSTARMQTANTSNTTSKVGTGDNIKAQVHVPEDDKKNIPVSQPKHSHQQPLPVESLDAPTATKRQPQPSEGEEGEGGKRRVTRASTRNQSPTGLPPRSTRTATRSRTTRTCTRGGRGANTKATATKSKEEEKAEQSLCGDAPPQPVIQADGVTSHASRMETPEKEKEKEITGISCPDSGGDASYSTPPLGQPVSEMEVDDALPHAQGKEDAAATKGDLPSPSQAKASPLGTATRRQMRSRVKRSALPPPMPSSPLVISSKKRLRTGASSTAKATGKHKSSSAAAQNKESPHCSTAMSHGHSKKMKAAVTAPPAPGEDRPSNAVPAAHSGTPQLSCVPPHIAGHGEFDTPQNDKAGSDSDDQDTFHTPMTSLHSVVKSTVQPMAESNSESGSLSKTQLEGGLDKREGHGSICGKRLRSVSLEKLPLDDIKPKRISLLVNSPESEGESRGVPPPPAYNSPDTAPSGGEDLASGCSSEENMPSDNSQELHASPLGDTASPSSCSDSSTPEERAPTISSEEGNGTSDSSPSDHEDRAVAEHLTHVPSALGAGFSKSPVVNLTKTKPSPWSFLSKKTEGGPPKLVFSNGGRPISFLPRSSPKKQEAEGKLALANGTVLPLSFVARNSPQQKVDAKESRQKKLVERLLKKKEEEEQRKRDLEEKRLHEIEERKRRNTERAQRAAEKRKQEQEKKLLLRKKVQEMESDELSRKKQKLNQQKAHERQERTKKHNEHVAAVLARKKVEDELKSKKLQQIEEDRKMAEELQRQRMEREEEERQQKRLERQRLEMERQTQREAEEKERQMQREAEERERQLQREAEEHQKQEEERRQKRLRLERERQLQREAEEREMQVQREAEERQKQDVASGPKGRPTALTEEKKKVFQQLLASTCAVNMPSSTSRFIQEWKNKLPNGTVPTTVTKNKPALPIPLPSIDTSKENCPPLSDTSPPTDLNSTFTKETTSRDIPHQTPVHTSGGSRLPEAVQSYSMTPAEPILTNYDIQDLSSGDSTDEEDRPKKPIPVWALPSHLKPIVLKQEERVSERHLDPCDIFPPSELLKDVDLARIFKHKRRRFYHRSSSARWDSPILAKKGRMDDISV